MSALSDVRRYGNLPVPLKVRNPVTKLIAKQSFDISPKGAMKETGYGKGYDLSAQAGKYDKESLLPENLKEKKYYDKR